jgi:hypothetical protein
MMVLLRLTVNKKKNKSLPRFTMQNQSAYSFHTSNSSNLSVFIAGGRMGLIFSADKVPKTTLSICTDASVPKRKPYFPTTLIPSDNYLPSTLDLSHKTCLTHVSHLLLTLFADSAPQFSV